MTLGVLVTLAQPKQAAANAHAAHLAGLPVVVDSGAWSVFTGSVTMDVTRHGDLVERWGASDRFVGLDVIGDGDASWANWRVARERGLAVEPTIHYGTDPKALDRYVSFGLATDWVNLGGVVAFQKSEVQTQRVASWCAAVMIRHPDLRYHGLGCTAAPLNRLVPFSAVDSTYWLAFGRFRQLKLFDPDAGQWVTFYVPRKGKTKELMEQSWKRGRHYGRLLLETYGVGLDFLRSATDDELSRVAIMAQMVFAKYFRKLHSSEFVCYLAGAGPKNILAIKEAL